MPLDKVGRRFEISYSTSMWLGNYAAHAPRIFDLQTETLLLDTHDTSWDGSFEMLDAGRFRLRLSAIHNERLVTILADADAEYFQVEDDPTARPIATLRSVIDQRLAPSPAGGAPPYKRRPTAMRLAVAGGMLALAALILLSVAS